MVLPPPPLTPPTPIQRGVRRGWQNSAALSVKDQRWKLNESDSSIEKRRQFHNPGLLCIIGPDLWPPRTTTVASGPTLFKISHLPPRNIARWLRQIWFRRDRPDYPLHESTAVTLLGKSSLQPSVFLPCSLAALLHSVCVCSMDPTWIFFSSLF